MSHSDARAHPSANDDRPAKVLATILLTVTLGGWPAAPVHADTLDNEADDIAWNGFLNVAGGKARKDSYSLENPQGPFVYDESYGRDVSFDYRTSAALQATKALDDRSTITAQLYASGAEDNYAAQMKQLHLTWKWSERSKFRIGRLNTPVYYFSDYINVGYAYHWITPPEWLYSFDTTFTGIDYVYQASTAGMDWSFEALYGGQSQLLPSIDTHISANDMRGLVLTLSPMTSLTLRAAWFRETASYESQNLFADELVDQTLDIAIERAAEFPDQANLIKALRPVIEAQMTPYVEGILTMDERPGTYRELAIRYERDDWMIMAEATRIDADTYLFDVTRTYYLTGGYRTGKAFWHLTYADLYAPISDAAANDYAATRADPATVAPVDLPGYAARLIGVNSAFLYCGNFRDWTAGVSIDTSDSSLLKFEVTYSDQIEDRAGDTAGVGTNLILKTALHVMF